jgi:type II secretory pathway pseudopilin PulG
MTARAATGRSTLAAGPASARGSAIVELLVGLVAAVLAVLSAALLISHHDRLRRTDAETDLALAACRSQIEELRSLPLTSLPALDGTGFDVPGPDGRPGGLEPVPGDADGLPGRFTITVDQTGGAPVYVVRATVTWTGSLAPQTFEVEAQMSARP